MIEKLTALIPHNAFILDSIFKIHMDRGMPKIIWWDPDLPILHGCKCKRVEALLKQNSENIDVFWIVLLVFRKNYQHKRRGDCEILATLPHEKDFTVYSGHKVLALWYYIPYLSEELSKTLITNVNSSYCYLLWSTK